MTDPNQLLDRILLEWVQKHGNSLEAEPDENYDFDKEPYRVSEKLKAKILANFIPKQTVVEAVGEDDHSAYGDYAARNQLRQEIRKELGL